MLDAKHESPRILTQQLLSRNDRTLVIFFALVMWLGGGMLYIWTIALNFYRYTFLPLDPANWRRPTGLTWAMAISTLAGMVLAGLAGSSLLLTELLPFVK